MEVNSILFNSIDWETVLVQANITSNFAAPVFSQTFIPDEDNINYNFMYQDITEQKLRFWRFTFTNSVGTTYCEAGKIFLGKRVTFINDDMVLGWTYTEKDFSKIQTNESGQRFIDVITKKQKRLEGSYQYVSLENLTIMQALGDEHSKVSPLWVVLDNTEEVVTELERNAMYCYLESIPPKKNTRFKLYDFSISLIECL